MTIVVSSGIQVLSGPRGAVQRGVQLRAADLPGLRLRGYPLRLAPMPTPSLMATKLGLPSYAYVPCSEEQFLRHGQAIMRALTKAFTAHDLAELRRVYMWAPDLTLRFKPLVAYLDAHSDLKRGGFFRVHGEVGRPDAATALLTNLLAVRALMMDRGLSTVAAVKVVEGCGLDAPVSAKYLRNAYGRYRRVLDAIACGYAVPADQLTDYRWPDRPTDVFTAY